MQKISIFKAIEMVQLYIEEQLATTKTGEIAPIPYLQGPPGMGKSAILNALADQLKVKDGRRVRVLAEHPALRPLEYFSGIPMPAGHGEATWTKPEVLKLETEPKEEIVLWFWDDFHLTDTSVAKYLFELFTYRKLHRYPLPENTVFILAGNDSREAGRGKLLTPIVNRLGIIPVTLPVDEWEKAYLFGQPLEELGVRIVELSDEPAYPDPIVAGFLRRFPEFAMEKENPYSPYGTYRSWTFLGKLLTRYKQHWGTPTFADLKILAQAHVSEKAAGELVMFAKVYYQFDPAAFYDENKTTAEVTEKEWWNKLILEKNPAERLTLLYAQIFQLTDYLCRQKQYEKYVPRFYNYLKKVTEKLSEEIPGAQGVIADALRQVKYRKKEIIQAILQHDLKVGSKWLRQFVMRKIGGLT